MPEKRRDQMKKSVLVCTLCMVAISAAAEWPVIPDAMAPLRLGLSSRDAVRSASQAVEVPVWVGLERMSADERDNSLIDVELGSDAPRAAFDLANRIEDLWNQGECDEALAMFPRLSGLTDDIAIGNTWINPLPTESTGRWGNDVRIGNRDSVAICALDIDRSSGNLFTVLLYEDTLYQWSVNFSTDGGENWNETYAWWAAYEIVMVDACVLDGHCYVGYLGSYAEEMRARRFLTSDATADTFPSGDDWVEVYAAAPETFSEIALTGNQDYYNNRLYYLGLRSDGEVVHMWYNPNSDVWTEMSLGVTNASQGLDANCNEGYADYFLVSSYIGVGDSVRIFGMTEVGTWEELIAYYLQGSNAWFSSISAYHDTITSFFEYDGVAALHCRYLVSYAGGIGLWYYGVVDDSLETSESPDITSRDGGGVGLAYRFYTDPRELRYSWRNYGGGWISPETFSDMEPATSIRPSIEYLGSDVYGVAYVSWYTETPPYAAYFDRSDWIDVAEDRVSCPARAFVRLSPSVTRGEATLSYALEREGEVTVSLYDASGRLLSTLVDGRKSAGEHTLQVGGPELQSGIYFLRVETPTGVRTERMTVVR
jgi:hypothetical protein